jgi:cytochrome b561
LALQWSIVSASGACVAQGTTVPPSAKIKVRAVLQRASAWLSVGWNTNGNMVGTDSILALPVGAGSVLDTHLTSKSSSGVVTDSVSDVQDAQVTTPSGTTVLEFSRPLSTGDSNDFNLLPAAQTAGSTVTWVWAHGGANTPQLSYHQARGGVAAVLVSDAPLVACSTEQERNAAGICVLSPTATALIPLVFPASIATINSLAQQGAAERNAFLQQVAADVEAALGITSSAGSVPVSGRVLATAVQIAADGRVTITIALLPAAAAGSALAAATGSNRTASVAALSSAMLHQLATPSSSMYSGAATSNLDRTAGANTNAAAQFTPNTPSSAVAPEVGCSTLPFTAEVDSSLSISWAIVTASGLCLDTTAQAIPADARLKMRVRLQRDAWVAVAFNSEARMVGSDGVAGYPPSTVRDIDISAKSSSGVAADAQQDISDASIQVTSGATEMTFTRPLRTGDSADFDLLAPTQADNSVTMIWARGSTGQRGNSIHARSDRGSLSVALASGTIIESSNIFELMHGILMTVSWCVMVPLGVMSVLRLRPRQTAACCGLLKPATSEDASQPQTWYVWHWRFQMAAFLAAVTAFIFALVFVGSDGPATTHAYLGIAVFTLMAAHVLAALVRPGVPAKGEEASTIRKVWSWAHFILGRGLPVLALGAVLSGWIVYGLAAGGAVAIPVALTLATVVASYFLLPKLLDSPTPPSPTFGKAVVADEGSSGVVPHGNRADINPMYA